MPQNTLTLILDEEDSSFLTASPDIARRVPSAFTTSSFFGSASGVAVAFFKVAAFLLGVVLAGVAAFLGSRDFDRAAPERVAAGEGDLFDPLGGMVEEEVVGVYNIYMNRLYM